jgi:hypothetical protein
VFDSSQTDAVTVVIDDAVTVELSVLSSRDLFCFLVRMFDLAVPVLEKKRRAEHAA